MRRSIGTLRRALPGAHDCPADQHRAHASAAAGRGSALLALVCISSAAIAGAAGPSGLATTRDDLSAADLARVVAITRPADRFLQIRTIRADAGRRRHVAQAGQPGCLFALLGQHHLRGRRHVQARQRHLPQGLGFGAVVDAGFRRARPVLQRARLPELPSEGRARPSAGRRRPTRPRCSCGWRGLPRRKRRRRRSPTTGR